MSDAENSVRSAPRVVGRPFAPGQSGNPGGRPRTLIDVQELARTYTEQAVRTLAEALDDPKLKVQAACALLDRGWGKPQLTIAADQNTSPGALHFLAATEVSQEMRAALNGPRAIDGRLEPASVQADGKIVDLLALPLPEE
jgi:hypothetical protein